MWEKDSIQKDKRDQVMIIDDAPDNIALFSELLKVDYKVRIALNGERALRLMKEEAPDLILLDVMMPVLDGYETCKRIKEEELLKEVPVIFLTARTDPKEESYGLSIGAVDYITKPVNPEIFLSRVKAHLAIKKNNDLLKGKNSILEQEIQRRMKEVIAFQEITIMAMSALSEIRDNETGNHIRRTKFFAQVICTQLLKSSPYQQFLNPNMIQHIVNAVPLHDLGKIGIPDAILLKPGKLSQAEFEIMKTHTTLGREAIEKAERMIDCPDDFLEIPKQIIYYHHEKWNGLGYPTGLKGEAIPLPARIVALVDVYDAMRSKRVYKPPFTHEQTVKIIENEAFKHFDPVITQAFIETKDQFADIFSKFTDE